MAAHLGLVGYHSIQFFVKDLERSVRWHKEKFDFREVARSTKDSELRHCMRSIALRGPGHIGWIFTQPIEAASTAGKYLKNHPEGVGFLNFEVTNVAQTSEFLAERKAPFLYDIQQDNNQGGLWRETAIATPLSDAGFRFIEKSNYPSFAPGFEWTADWNNVGGNKYKFSDVDHVTCNMRAMIGLTEFYRHCLGFERYWGIEFHTAHHNPSSGTGSGLESIVMWDPHSGIKFATNQPLAPYFNNSQIQIYIEDNGGGGIQHVALAVPEIIPVVHALRKDGCRFLDAPSKYYEQLPKRIAENRIGTLREPMDHIRKEGILVDGHDSKYLLQLFMKEMCEQFGDSHGGPFFYEIIQRAGDPGFGDGNFKALFDSIEQGQVALSRQEMRDRIDCLF